MIIEENWAVSMQRIREFFREQPDVSEQENGFFYAACRITLVAAQSNTGPFALTRTIVRIEGPQDQARAIHHRFFLRFLSAGG